MVGKYKFEQEFKKVLEFSENGVSDYEKIKKLQEKVYSILGEDMINNHTDTIAAMVNLFKEENIAVLEKLFLEYEKAPIGFSYIQMVNDIKDFARCKDVTVDVAKLDNFNDLRKIILDTYEEQKNSFLTKSMAAVKIGILIRIILSSINENDSKIRRILRILPGEKRALEDYVTAFSNHEIISDEVIDKVTNMISQREVIGFDDSSYENNFAKYNAVHNEIIRIDSYGNNVPAMNPNYKEKIKWADGMDMDEFVDMNFNRLSTCNEGLMMYMLPENNFPKYDEFLNLILKKFRKQLEHNPNMLRRYEALEELKNKSVYS